MGPKADRKYLVLGFHLLVWAVLFSLPYLLSSDQEQLWARMFVHSWIPLLFYAFIFYLNYLVLIERFLFKKKGISFVLANIAIIGFSLWLRGELNTLYFQEIMKPPRNGDGPPFKLFLYVQIVSLMVPIVFSIALKTTERWIRTEAERKETTNIKLKSELQHLRYQLQPHFFFNSLNNIYSLVDISPEQAKSTIHSLGKLMRYLLYETNIEEVPLSREIDFMEKYIDLMRLRLSDNTKVESHFPSLGNDIKIAPLLFISLIENAFKHGVSANKESVISIEMEIQGKEIAFRTENFNFPKNNEDKSGSGIGLQNLEKRLQLLYPNKHSFHTSLQNGIFIATLKIGT